MAPFALWSAPSTLAPMTTIPAALAPAHPQLRAAAALLRSTIGLLVHAFTHPFAPAAIDRRTGRVVAR